MLTPIRLASCMHNDYAGALPQTRPTFVFPTIHASEKPGLAAAPRRRHERRRPRPALAQGVEAGLLVR